QLEYDFIVQPGGRADQIRMNVAGASSLSLNKAGDLVVSTAAGDVVQKAPVLYQTASASSADRQSVSGRYKLFADGTPGLEVTGAYDGSRALYVDPVVSYQTVLGGVADDEALGVAADGTGSVYLTGWTASASFPGATGTLSGPTDAFVTKLAPDGSVVYSSYLGGSNNERGFDVAVSPAGNAYVTGYTNSSGTVSAFPTTTGPS